MREGEKIDTTPPLSNSLTGYRKNKPIYGNKFHTFGRGVKGLGSAAELTDWISALVADARF